MAKLNFNSSSPKSTPIKTEAQRIVEKEIQIVEVPIERIVERIIEIERRIEVPVERVVDRIVEVEKQVEKIVHVEVEKLVEVEKKIEVFVDRWLEKPVEKIYTNISVVPPAMLWIIGIEAAIIAVLMHIVAK